MSLDLAGRNAIVTGAATGIGRGISQRFAELGAKVSAWDIQSVDMASDLALSHTATVDVTDPESVNTAFTSTLEALGSVDIFVANAGINGPTKPTWEYTVSEWENVLKVDLTGVFISTLPAIQHMRASGKGRIIIVASVAGKEGNPGACAYGAAKAGVIGFAKGLARELQPSEITVNCVAPAITKTDLFNQMDADYIAEKKAKIPMGRFCTIAEVADMTAFIASPRCSFTTGQVFDITGGRATY